MTQAAKTHRDLGSRASSARCQTLRVHNVPTPWTSVDLPSSHRGRGMAHRFGLEPCRWALRPLSAAQRLAAKAPRMVADATGRRGLRGLQAILRRGVRWKRRTRGRGEARCTGEARHPYPSLSPSPAARRASPRLLESRGASARGGVGTYLDEIRKHVIWLEDAPCEICRRSSAREEETGNGLFSSGRIQPLRL